MSHFVFVGTLRLDRPNQLFRTGLLASGKSYSTIRRSSPSLRDVSYTPPEPLRISAVRTAAMKASEFVAFRCRRTPLWFGIRLRLLASSSSK